MRRDVFGLVGAVVGAPVRSTVRGMFAHADPPMADPDVYPGDCGLFGPDSVSWRVMSHPSAFIAGIRALMLQAAHPEVLAGVVDHSTYRSDPLGRLSRTANWVTATTFGAMPDVEAAVGHVRRAHSRVSGVSYRGVRYCADDPVQAAFVHNALVDSFLAAYQWCCDPVERLSVVEADRFVVEQHQVAALLGIENGFDTAEGLRVWLVDHPDVGWSPALEETQRFLAAPPLPAVSAAGYRVLRAGAVLTLPAPFRTLLGVSAPAAAGPAAKALTAALGVLLGESPTLVSARQRCAATSR